MSKFVQDFKKFIKRGNVVDLAVGVIIGNAFSAIVTALTQKIIMPFVNWILSIGGAEDGLASAYTFLRKITLEDGTIDYANSIYIDWGAFITAIFNFFIIALTLFVIVKVAMKSNEIFTKARLKTLKNIENNIITRKDRKILKSRGISLRDKKAVDAYLEERKEAKRQEILLLEQKKALDDEEKKKNSQEYILKEIRDLLAKQVNQNQLELKEDLTPKTENE